MWTANYRYFFMGLSLAINWPNLFGDFFGSPAREKETALKQNA